MSIPMAEYIHQIMADTAGLLARSLDVYWPTNVGALNDLPERNLSAHFSHAMLKRNFHLYAEVNNQYKQEKELLDILCISPDKKYHVACEFKTYTNGSMRRSSKDLNRVNGFPLNVDLCPKTFGTNYVETVKGCGIRVGLVAGVLWRRQGDSLSLKGSGQKIFADKVAELGGYMPEEPILVREYRPDNTGANIWSGGYYLYYALLGAGGCTLDMDGNLLAHRSENSETVTPVPSPLKTPHMEEVPFRKTQCISAKSLPVSAQQSLPALLFHPNYRRKLTEEEETRLDFLENVEDKTPSESTEYSWLKGVQQKAFTGSKYHSQYNKVVKKFKQGCYDDGKYLFLSPTFCNETKATSAPRDWIATYDQSGTPVWICSKCLSVYPRKER